MNWRGYTSTPDGATATGLRGRYTIRWLAGRYVLTATGHDDLPMLALNPWGRQFTGIDDAKVFAERVDTTKTVEPQASGA